MTVDEFECFGQAFLAFPVELCDRAAKFVHCCVDVGSLSVQFLELGG